MHAAWILAVWAMAAGGDKPAMPTPPRVRAAHGTERMLEDAAARSGTVRALLDRLAATDVIVYVEFTGTPDVPTARTTLVTTTPSARFLRIAINAAQPPGAWLPLLGHELQHALEIAEHTDVRDDSGVRRLYAAIGDQYGIDSYETQAAVQIERLVRGDLRR